MKNKPEWERVLWKKQNYPDNYVGPSFFRVRTKCEKISYSQAFYGSLLVSLEICSCIFLVAIFYGLEERSIRSSHVLLCAALLSILGHVVIKFTKYLRNEYSDNTNILDVCINDLKVALFTVVLGYFFAPIIKTLTASVATDSIQACTVGLLFLHLVFYPYGAHNAIVNPVMSHNLGLFAAVCLASRLQTNQDVFALVMVAVLLFSLLPIFKEFCQNSFRKLHFGVVCAAAFGSTFFVSWFFAPALSTLVFVTLIGVNGVCPAVFMWLQPYRKNIYGPWDEATIKEKKS